MSDEEKQVNLPRHLRLDIVGESSLAAVLLTPAKARQLRDVIDRWLAEVHRVTESGGVVSDEEKPDSCLTMRDIPR